MPLPRMVEMEKPETPDRLRSVDIYRGAAIAAMVLVNAQFSHDDSYRQLAHAAWHGWTFADTVFPTFLFIVGVSLALSTSARASRGQTSTDLLAHALTRALILLCCGIAIDYIRFPVREFPFAGFQPHVQITGVLQKIAICYLVAFAIHLWLGLRGAILAIVGFNILYFALLYHYPVPGCPAGSMTVTCNFPGYIDRVLLDGVRWNSDAFDPDGIGAILPAITTVLFGTVAGQFLENDKTSHRRLLWLVVAGAILIGVGELLATRVPFNKQLWTPSFAVLMAGLSTIGLALVTYLVDGRKWARWLSPLQILGKNALSAYLMSRLIENVPRVRVRGASLYNDFLARIAQPPNASLLFAVIVLGLVFVMVWLLERWRLQLKV